MDKEIDIIHIPVYALLPHLLPSEASKTRLSTMPAFVQFPDVQPVEGHVSPSKNLAAVPHHKEDARSGSLQIGQIYTKPLKDEVPVRHSYYFIYRLPVSSEVRSSIFAEFTWVSYSPSRLGHDVFI
jgi:hypothetical protein